MTVSRYVIGDALDVLRGVATESFNCCITSPPYWGLRDYGAEGQIGLESTPDEYVARMVEVFAEVHRTLRGDGTLWLNLGDSYAGSGRCLQGDGVLTSRTTKNRPGNPDKNRGVSNRDGLGFVQGLKPKDLVGIPWRVAFALQADGWYLRSDIIWAKPNPMPESVTDRPTKAHEYLFLLAKSERYHYDHEAIKETAVADHAAGNKNGYRREVQISRGGRGGSADVQYERRNKRTVWTVNTKPYGGAHFATMPEALIEPCILAGCPPGGTVMDPFFGSGTTGMVCERLGRRWFGVELNPDYEPLIRERTAQRGLFA